MPRQRGRSAAPARSGPSRPIAAPARPNVTPPQPPTRSSSTAAHPPATTQQQPQAGKGSGLFGQMASTAAGVAVGSSIGHALGGFFGGGSSQAPIETQAADGMVASQAQDGTSQSTSFNQNCEVDAKAFTKCLDENKGEYQMSICGWYLEQLVRQPNDSYGKEDRELNSVLQLQKACQSAASQY